MGLGVRAVRLLLRPMPGPGPKRPRSAMAPRIGTHSGTFHCDEALACYLLRLLPQYRDAEIIRTREPQLLSECDVVVDVGGEYDPQKHRYDHHQRSFAQSMHCLRPDKPWKTKLSSAGLVYFHFGSQVLASVLGLKEEDPVVQALYDKLYENFVEEIDAIDNGVAQWDGEPRYAMTTNLSARVAYLNPRWNDPDQDTEAGFKKAMELVGREFLGRLDYYHRSWLPARTLVEEAIQRRFEVSSRTPGFLVWGLRPALACPRGDSQVRGIPGRKRPITVLLATDWAGSCPRWQGEQSSDRGAWPSAQLGFPRIIHTPSWHLPSKDLQARGTHHRYTHTVSIRVHAAEVGQQPT